MVTNRFAGKTIVITGTASGVGRAAAVRFAEEGGHVIGADLNVEGGEETVGLCSAAGGTGSFLKTDVSIEDDVKRLVDHAVRSSGTVDVLFNNAGYAGKQGPIESFGTEEWDLVLNTCLRSVFFGIKHVVPQMKKQATGSILSTSSIAGQRGFSGSPAYCTAKAGIINLTRAAAVELAPFGIRANCIAPGFLLTPMQPRTGTVEELEAQLAGMQPQGRAGLALDVANAALFLASGDADWITGEVLTVDGGATAGVWKYR